MKFYNPFNRNPAKDLPLKEAPPTNTVGVGYGQGDPILESLGFSDRQFDTFGVSHLPAPGKTIDNLEKDKAHIVAKHIDKDEQFLLGRFNTEKTPASTSFRNKEEASKYISLTIDANKKEIEEFLKDPTRKDLIIRGEFKESVGYGYTREHVQDIDGINAHQRLESRFTQVRLIKDNRSEEFRNPEGFRVVTAFPDMAPGSGNIFTPLPSAKSFDSVVEKVSDRIETMPKESFARGLFSPGVSVEISASLSQAKEVAKDYGNIPGGMVLSSYTKDLSDIKSIGVDLSREGVLVINEQVVFETGLSAEEIALLYDSVFVRKDGQKRFGATSTEQVFGTNKSNIVGTTLRLADSRFGELIFGVNSSTRRLGESSHPEYINPEQKHLEGTIKGDKQAREAIIQRLILNETGYFFFDFRNCAFQSSNNLLTCTNIELLIHPVIAKGTQSAPSYVGGEERFKVLYPESLSVINHLKENLTYYGINEPYLNKLLKYAAVLALFRASYEQNAEVSNQDLLDRINKYQPTVWLDNYTSRTYNSTSELQTYQSASTEIYEQFRDATKSLKERLDLGVVGYYWATKAGDQPMADTYSSGLNELLMNSEPDQTISRELIALIFKMELVYVTGFPSDVEIKTDTNNTRPLLETKERIYDIANHVAKLNADIHYGGLYEELSSAFERLELFNEQAFWESKRIFNNRNEHQITILHELDQIEDKFNNRGALISWLYAFTNRYISRNSTQEIIDRYVNSLVEKNLYGVPSMEVFCEVLLQAESPVWHTGCEKIVPMYLLKVAKEILEKKNEHHKATIVSNYYIRSKILIQNEISKGSLTISNTLNAYKLIQ